MTTASFTVRDADWTRDAAALRDVRTAVFIVEQAIPPDLEWDLMDVQSQHALAVDADGQPIGCGRLLPDGHVGRMAVVKRWRGHGVGAALLARLVERARQRGDAQVILNAQTHALAFYAAQGFVAEGGVYDEAGLPHQTMRRVF